MSVIQLLKNSRDLSFQMPSATVKSEAVDGYFYITSRVFFTSFRPYHPFLETVSKRSNE
jgi:hypothetical protein